jgi:hypothetical protein
MPGSMSFTGGISMPSDAERILQTKIDHLVRAKKYSTSAAVDGSLNAILALDRQARTMWCLNGSAPNRLLVHRGRVVAVEGDQARRG